ncbi:proline iminopeptidase-family hydrolase [Flavobacterium ammonificans]|jgi:proline iminopeptidase|uniref:proline iminopeptidase-family hydrolase n=1 Tax=Flavobacterium ammonificans TaxID=1751056 RepID=UPI001E5D5787|nr:proline iminopeptidase-family hydrolase [Flavobacterium ammonificans]BDB57338.1 proline iminopeptidase [Flavobacterium ammonificans]
MKTFATFFLVVLLSFFVSCQKIVSENSSVYFEKSNDSIQNGGVKVIPITTSKGTFNVWTKRIGNNPKIKLLLLNGGPGATHEYFECFENFLPAEGIEIIYYDQLGCGNSDNPNDAALWDLGRYVEEVEQVRKALHLDESNFYVLGHSWGGILAMEYTLKYQHNMKGLIISNMMSSCPEYGRYADEVLAKQMDPKVLAEINKIEAAKDFANPRYMELLIPNFYEKHILRFPSKDWPEPVNRSFAKMNQSLYVTMQGPSEFGISGKLEKWDRKSDLKKITIPTLVIGAKYDTMDPNHMSAMSKLVQNGTYLFCSKGSHMAFYDDQKTYFKGLIAFLNKSN